MSDGRNGMNPLASVHHFGARSLGWMNGSAHRTEHAYSKGVAASPCDGLPLQNRRSDGHHHRRKERALS